MSIGTIPNVGKASRFVYKFIQQFKMQKIIG